MTSSPFTLTFSVIVEEMSGLDLAFVCTNVLKFFGLLYLHRRASITSPNLSFDLTPVHAQLRHVSVCQRVVKCFQRAHDGIRVTAVQITCNCDLLWWGINFAALHAVR